MIRPKWNHTPSRLIKASVPLPWLPLVSPPFFFVHTIPLLAGPSSFHNLPQSLSTYSLSLSSDSGPLSLFSMLSFLVSVSGGGPGKGAGVFSAVVVAFSTKFPTFFVLAVFVVASMSTCVGVLGQGHFHLTLNCFQWASECLAWEQPPTGVNIGE